MEGKILVVDDEETTRRSLADILRLEGCRVQSAANGEEAVAFLRKETFDLVLLDLKMPGMDGLEVLRLASQMTPDTQIILLTAHGSLESAIEALRSGAHDYLLKPSSPKQILQSVQSGLARRHETQRKRMLLAQLEASLQELRGAEDSTAPLAPAEPDVLTLANGTVIDLARRRIVAEDHHISLTPTEGRLLKVFVENRGRVFTHRELVSRVQGYETSEWEAPEVLRPLVSRLRQKLTAIPGGEKWIVNVRGTGYLFEPGRG
jgi:DNA-binding response OmpR family regulator